MSDRPVAEPQDDEEDCAPPKKGGRPSIWQDSFLLVVNGATQLGATDREIAQMIGVSERTLNNWKHTRPELAEALKIGKEVADNRVERSLYQRALGYEQEEVKIFMPAGADKPVYASYVAKVAADTTAAIFWLKNRRGENWRDRTEKHHTGTVAVEHMDADQARAEISRFLEGEKQKQRGEETSH